MGYTLYVAQLPGLHLGRNYIDVDVKIDCEIDQHSRD